MQKSKATGPKTPEGKRTSAMNALRHGLTGRVVVLPSEDMNAYYAFCNELMKDLAAEGALEKQYAQTFCDTQWRLNRVRSIEESMLALGPVEDTGEIDPGHPEIHAALVNAQVFREQSKQFANLSLYEQRLNRTLKESLRQLQELQSKRIAERQAALDEAVALRNLLKMKRESWNPETDPANPRFVFSTLEIEAEARRQYRRADTENAKRFNYDLSLYRKYPLKQAA